jgi:integrase/recombinase XerC
MDTVHRSRRTDIDWLADGPIGPFIDAFKQFLTERRYAGDYIQQLLGLHHSFRPMGAEQAP